MSFDLFGIDIIPTEEKYGFWIFNIGGSNYNDRSLLGLYWNTGTLFLDILFVRFDLQRRVVK